MPKIQVQSLSYVTYQHPDLKIAVQFLTDFGFKIAHRTESPKRVYFRGSSSQPYLYVAEQSLDSERHFQGATWLVNSLHDLRIAASLPSALSGVVEDEGPGGGLRVTLMDPAGLPIHFIYGKEQSCELPYSTEGQEVNYPQEKPRLGRFQRFQHGPSEVHKFGHYGLMVPAAQFPAMVEFYKGLMNITDSDTNFDPSTGLDQVKFMHIDKGKEYADHHSFFLGAIPGNKPYIHHSSFEVQNLDSQLLGHYWLQSKGYRNCWGVGRHVLGSQIFDYWFDETGFILEHYSDGDLVNEDTIASREAAGPDSLHIWGPNVPISFLTAQAPDREGNESDTQAPDVEAAKPAIGIAEEFLPTTAV